MAKHKDGANTAQQGGKAGKHRGIETGNGRTASTGRGVPKGVVFKTADGRTAGTRAGKASRLRTIADVFTRKTK